MTAVVEPVYTAKDAAHAQKSCATKINLQDIKP